MHRLGVAVVVAMLGIATATPSATAHGDVSRYEPRSKSRLDAVPPRVRITLTEPPVAAATAVTVIDGCARDVTSGISVRGHTVAVSVDEGQPGRWRARWEAVSSVDGHASDGVLRFAVRGERDCSAAAPAPGTDRTDGVPDGGSFPVIPVVAGGIALVVIAALARRATAP